MASNLKGDRHGWFNQATARAHRAEASEGRGRLAQIAYEREYSAWAEELEEGAKERGAARVARRH